MPAAYPWEMPLNMENESDTMVDPVLADDFTQRDEPLALFQEWYGAATLSEPNDPNAMGLATVDASGMPNLRMVLLKDLDPRGLTFYTNLESAKGVELLPRPRPLPVSIGSRSAARSAFAAPSNP